MPNGEEIGHNTAAITFVEVIEKLGVEKVRSLEKRYIIPLISTSEDAKYKQHRLGPYYIMTTHSTQTKKRLIEEIASDLGLDKSLKVELVEKS